ncbi:MAG: hypothetical protein GYA24_06845 [Candidatus Lokiarchaeota archaeon]|nr:hypothetical protein [Candidatus Lokiarchaeota archaeon]
MLATTHAFVSVAVAAILFWKMPCAERPNHGRFMLFTMAAGMLVDFDFLSGFLELALTNTIPPTLQQFISIGRQNHPVFTHSMITLAIAGITAAFGLLLLARRGACRDRPAGITSTSGASQVIATGVTFAVTVTPQLLLRLDSSHWWGIDDIQSWSFNVSMAIIFLAGIGIGMAANVNRPAHVLVLGTGICLHLLCDMVQYWVLVLGPFDPAWAAGMAPARVGLDLYSDSDVLIGVIVEGPAHAFIIAYLAWFLAKGKKRIGIIG